MKPPAELVDRIVYTASLASNFQDIDAILEPLREVTAVFDISKPLPAEAEQRLLGVQRQLENYLVTEERLRQFTPESLALQIDQHMQGNTEKRAVPQLRAVIIASTVVAIIAGALPMLDDAPQRGRVGSGVLFSAFTVGAAWLFLNALPAFTSELRRAFKIICLGVTLLGLSLIEQPLFHALGIEGRPMVNLLYPMPIIVASILFHAGNLAYVRLVGVRSVWATMRPAILAALVLSVISWFMPHPNVHGSELLHDVTSVIWAWIVVMPIGSAIALPMAVRMVPELYKPPIRALAQAMLPTIAVTGYLFVLNVMAGSYANVDSLYVYILFGFVVCMSMFLLRAGYIFNKVSKY